MKKSIDSSNPIEGASLTRMGLGVGCGHAHKREVRGLLVVEQITERIFQQVFLICECARLGERVACKDMVQ